MWATLLLVSRVQLIYGLYPISLLPVLQRTNYNAICGRFGPAIGFYAPGDVL